MKSKFKYLLLGILTVISFSLRFYDLSNLPKAFAADEAALGYNAWSLLLTGKDEWNKSWPLILRSFDDNKPAGYSYLTMPAVKLFGLNKATARSTAAFFGSLLPLIILGLILTLTKNFPLAFMSGLVIAISPWHIEISRTAIEAGVALSVAMMGLWLLVLNKKWADWTGVFLLFSTFYIYHTARLVVPLIVILGLLSKKIKKSKTQVIVLIGMLILGIVMSLTYSMMRFDQISIFNDLGAKLVREEAIREDGVFGFKPLWVTRAFHNKPWSWIQSFTESYITNTSLSFLFLGGAQPPRVTIPETGQFQLLLLPFLLLGLAFTVRKWDKLDRWLIYWLLVSPIPASLTMAELPHTYRTLFMLPPLAILISRGLIESYQLIKLKKKSLAYGLGLIVMLALGANLIKTWHQYRVHQQTHKPWFRQYGYKDLIDFINSVPNKNQVTITNREGEPYIFVLFYNQIQPKVFQDWPAKRLAHKDISAGAREWQMFNYSFSEDPCPYNLKDKDPNNLYVVMPTCELPSNFERIKIIKFMDGAPEFMIDRPIKTAI